jgi:uncharacterized membrane protein (DUF373 family)
MIGQKGGDPSVRHGSGQSGWTTSVSLLVAAERAVFSFVGVLFFIAAFALAVRATADLWTLAMGPHATTMAAGTAFLDIMLLVLMMVELAYTVTVSLRGTVLAAEPFLIVGLIAVIRRMLVITIGDVSPSSPSNAAGGVGSQPVELGILTGVVLVLVGSIVLLRLRPRLRDEFETSADG